MCYHYTTGQSRGATYRLYSSPCRVCLLRSGARYGGSLRCCLGDNLFDLAARWLASGLTPYGGLTPIPPAVEIYPRSTRTTHRGPRRTAKVVVCRTISRANVGSLLSIGVDFIRLHRGISPQLLSFVAPQRAHRWFHRDRLRASRIGRGNAKSWINQTFTALADPVLEKKLAYSNSKLTGMESQRSLVSGSITLARK